VAKAIYTEIMTVSEKTSSATNKSRCRPDF